MKKAVIGLENVTHVITKVREAFITGETRTYEQINDGYCDHFAGAVLGCLGVTNSSNGDAQFMNVERLQIATVNPQDFDDYLGQPFDRDKIAASWPETCPPDGLDWEDMDALSAFDRFAESTHSWIRIGDRHYDCEVPEGVASPFELPFFTRRIYVWEAAGRPRPAAHQGSKI